MSQTDRARWEMLWNVADSAEALPSAKEDVRRRLEEYFGGQDMTESEARQFVRDLKRQAPHLWGQGTPTTGAHQSGAGQAPPKPKRPVRAS